MRIIKLPTGTFTYDPQKALGKKGGFGQVFSGQTSEGTYVAIKKLHVSAAYAAHRELQIADELKGRTFDHVVPFIDSGEDADTGDYFLVMPRANMSLQDAVDKDGKMNQADVVVVLMHIVRGLNEVGDLVHRDLKPDNVLLHENRWKVADFGIARFIQEATASNTLKNCLSPYYAAPEQWRFDRATHATDVYALGCIGFFLLTGKPPYVTRPESEHPNSSLPQFDCVDARLKALIHNMVRKLPETRPTLSRIQSVLNEIETKSQISASDPIAALATAGAQIAEKEQQRQAERAAKQSAKEARSSLAAAAFEILTDSVERLWGRIHAQVPNAHRSSGRHESNFVCNLGRCSLAVNLSNLSSVDPGLYFRSGWDVVASSQILVTQEIPQYQWSASLLYVKLRGGTEYRWHEVSYWTSAFGRGNLRFEPYACLDITEADVAASSNIMGLTNIAFGPMAVDDEQENEFHARWIFLFAKAASGHLKHPASMPINSWPPQF